MAIIICCTECGNTILPHEYACVLCGCPINYPNYDSFSLNQIGRKLHFNDRIYLDAFDDNFFDDDCEDYEDYKNL